MMSGDNSFTIDRSILCMEGSKIYIDLLDNSSQHVIGNETFV
jgi:hypothetical protein